MSSQARNYSDQSAVHYYKTYIRFINQKFESNANRVFIRYFSNGIYKTLTFKEVDHITTNLACELTKKCVGVVSLISDHNLMFLITLLAILKTRALLFVISPRNSEAAISHLLDQTRSRQLFAAPKYKSLAQNAATQRQEVQLMDFNLDDLLKEHLNPQHTEILDTTFSDKDLGKSVLIIHSSGTTGFPKPIYLSNRYLLNLAGTIHRYKEQNPHLNLFNETDILFSPSPLFHMSGVHNISVTVAAGASYVFTEKPIPSQLDIEFALRSNQCTVMGCSPFIIEDIMLHLKKTQDLSNMQRLKYILVGGAPLKQEVNEWFEKNKIVIRSVYGSTEMGVIMMGNIDKRAIHLSSVRSVYYDSKGDSYTAFEDDVDGLKHMYVKAGSPNLALGISNRPDGGYNSNDLFEEDAKMPGYYLYRGRRDDTLVMENGEKTNPIPMEATLRQSLMIKQAAVLGEGRQCTMALIEINMTHAMNYNPQEIVSSVHQAVDQVNLACPNHSTILPQMIRILKFNQSLPVTDKGSLKRKMAETMYREIVEATYDDFMRGPQDATGHLFSLKEAVAEILPRSDLSDPSLSLFDLGLTSLTAIQLRNAIAKHYKDIPQSFVFQHSSIASIQDALSRPEDASKLIQTRYQQTQALAQSYIERAERDFDVVGGKKRMSFRRLPIQPRWRLRRADKVILLTGATGSLGAFILRDLLKDPTVKKVYCMIRGRESELHARLVTSFTQRQLDPSLLKRVETLPMRLDLPCFGLTRTRYDQLQREITIVQHCAWMLDFNRPIEHYDKECISGFYNLLLFAHHKSNPIHVHFISSVSASALWGPEVQESPLPMDSTVAAPMGYAHSKFVCEALLNYLVKVKRFPCFIERVGQVSGDTVSGIWNTTEQVPMMFVSGALMHKMPKLSSRVDWIPVDYASSAIVEIMLRTAHLPATEKNIFHIVNPHTTDWSNVLEAMRACGIEFDLVDPEDWIEALKQDETIPAYRLLPFYENSFKKDRTMPKWQTENTTELAPILAESPPFDPTLFKKYLDHWQSIGFYS